MRIDSVGLFAGFIFVEIDQGCSKSFANVFLRIASSVERRKHNKTT